MKRSLLKSLISVSLVAAPSLGVLLMPEAAEAAPPTSGKGVINGIVKNSQTGEPIEEHGERHFPHHLPGHPGAKAEVGARAKAKVLLTGAVDVEIMGPVEV